jgi:NADH-quinone oxidoreductase subunit J
VSLLAFFVLGMLAVASALGVVLNRNPVHGACALVAHLFLLAVFFVGLDAQLVGVLQVIVYAGAVVVLFLFVIMLLNLQADVRATAGGPVVAAAAAGVLALVTLIVAGLHDPGAAADGNLASGYGETRELARVLFTRFALPFELTSLLLLVAIVGAVVLARKRAEP